MQNTASGDDLSTSNGLEQWNTVFVLKKSLLMDVSVEMKNHVCNQMKEGNENQMILRDVDAVTFSDFVDWLPRRLVIRAFRNLHTVDKRTPEAFLVLFRRCCRLFIFAERFNILELRQKILDTYIMDLLCEMSQVRTKAWHEPCAEYLCSTIAELIENLPLDLSDFLQSEVEGLQKNNQDALEFMRYCLAYFAMHWAELKPHEVFHRLIKSHPLLPVAMLDYGSTYQGRMVATSKVNWSCNSEACAGWEAILSVYTVCGHFVVYCEACEGRFEAH